MIAEETDFDLLAQIHTHILRPSFAPAELDSLEIMAEGVENGTTSVVAVSTDTGDVSAVAVGEHDDAASVTLLSYLAAAPGRRGRGAGGAALDAALALWRERWGPKLILAEIEDPTVHVASGQFGDPARRVRFYARRGAVALDLPYYQPSLSVGSPRVDGMILVAWPGVQALSVGTRTDGRALSRFLRAYTDDQAHRDEDDPQRAALLAAASNTAGVRVIALEEATRRS